MSIISNYIGYRAIGDFMKRNEQDLLSILKPKKGKLPSFDVIRQVLIHIDFKTINQQFYNWAKQYVSVSKKLVDKYRWQSNRGTVANVSSIDQNFVGLVSLYCTKKKLVIGNAQVINSKKSEISVVQQLIEALNLTGVTFTLDALHCKKNGSHYHRQRKRLCDWRKEKSTHFISSNTKHYC